MNIETGQINGRTQKYGDAVSARCGHAVVDRATPADRLLTPAIATKQLWHFVLVHGVTTALSIAAIAGLPWYWTGKCEVLLLILMWVVTGNFGISVGYHRLFTHRSFETTPWLRSAFAILGSMAAQGPVAYWASVHRAHHMHSDREGDPHSPNSLTSRSGKLSAFCHGHFAWAVKHHVPSPTKYAPDLLRDSAIRRSATLYPLWVVLGVVVPGILGGLITSSWKGFVGGVLWGGCIRLVLVNHLIWAVNSIGHAFGHKEHETGDNSRNNAVLAVLTFGEGWHNTHHAQPQSASFASKWWHLDPGYYTIFLLKSLGLAWNVKRFPKRLQQTSGLQHEH